MVLTPPPPTVHCDEDSTVDYNKELLTLDTGFEVHFGKSAPTPP